MADSSMRSSLDHMRCITRRSCRRLAQHRTQHHPPLLLHNAHRTQRVAVCRWQLTTTSMASSGRGRGQVVVCQPMVWAARKVQRVCGACWRGKRHTPRRSLQASYYVVARRDGPNPLDPSILVSSMATSRQPREVAVCGPGAPAGCKAVGGLETALIHGLRANSDTAIACPCCAD